jgi:hypothetical protein
MQPFSTAQAVYSLRPRISPQPMHTGQENRRPLNECGTSLYGWRRVNSANSAGVNGYRSQCSRSTTVTAYAPLSKTLHFRNITSRSPPSAGTLCQNSWAGRPSIFLPENCLDGFEELARAEATLRVVRDDFAFLGAHDRLYRDLRLLGHRCTLHRGPNGYQRSKSPFLGLGSFSSQFTFGSPSFFRRLFSVAFEWQT